MFMDHNNPQIRPNSRFYNTIKSNINLYPAKKQIALIFLVAVFTLSVIPLIASMSINNNHKVFAQNATNQSSLATATGFDCASLPSKISKNTVMIQNPNKDVCDLVILRHTPEIIGHNGTILNKFLAINSMVELMKAPSNMSKGSSNPSSPMVIAMGEFGLLQQELKPVILTMSQAKWNITAVHNHPILENPPMIFVHWDTMGNLNIIVNQVKEIAKLDQTLSQKQQSHSNHSNNKSSGNNTSSDNNTSSNPLSAIGKQLGGALGLSNKK